MRRPPVTRRHEPDATERATCLARIGGRDARFSCASGSQPRPRPHARSGRQAGAHVETAALDEAVLSSVPLELALTARLDEAEQRGWSAGACCLSSVSVASGRSKPRAENAPFVDGSG